ncbi:CASTOR/POLLUX-related putative ion channel [Nonomuraea dietziae]|uniref:CASTOR/POLLUX-related putative ion channel n=1 Tax=Nonomuraea dietziae TaxID=65515 RepID=UPI0031D5F28A
MLWLSLMHAMTPSKVASDKGSTAFLAVMFVGSLAGIFIVSILVGLLSNGLKQKIDRLRRGRSRIAESGHTVVLGWSDQVFTIIGELVKAHASQRGSVIAVLADRDKLDMEEEIRERIGDTGRTRLVCRTGRPTEPGDLRLMNLDKARSIVVLSPDGEDPDAHVIKILLALAKRAGDHPPVVASLTSSRNLAAARLAGGSQVHLVDSDDTASRLIVQSSRQSGMSVVCMDLLNFDDGEIYLRSDAALTGRSYGEALHAYQTATVIGLRRAGGRGAQPTHGHRHHRRGRGRRHRPTTTPSSTSPRGRPPSPRRTSRSRPPRPWNPSARWSSTGTPAARAHRPLPGRLRRAGLDAGDRGRPPQGGHRPRRPAQPHRERQGVRHHRQIRARGARRRPLPARDRPVRRQVQAPARRHPHAHDPPAVARHADGGGRALLDRQRDARREQPLAGRGHRGRRHRHQRQP